jgi:predicted  nucleic acid-binding Zn-ribbon protein
VSRRTEQGVALAAIQGLNQKLEAQLKDRDAEIQDLKQSMADLKKMVQSLAERK